MPGLKTITILSAALMTSSCSVVEEMQDDLSKLSSQVVNLQRMQAEQTTTLSELRSRMRELSGQIEEINYVQNQKMGGDLTALKENLQELKGRIPPPAIVPVGPLEEDEILSGGFGEMIAPNFRDALQKIRAGKFNEALNPLQELLDRSNENREVAALANFWLGVSFDGLKDSRKAVQFYQEVVAIAPKSRRVPQSLLRMADSLARIDDSKTAILIYQKLAKEFPKSPEATVAREKLKGK